MDLAVDSAWQLCEQPSSPGQLTAATVCPRRIDRRVGRHLGGFPQVFTHLALMYVIGAKVGGDAICLAL
jgi:hypothetical protein